MCHMYVCSTMDLRHNDLFVQSGHLCPIVSLCYVSHFPLFRVIRRRWSERRVCEGPQVEQVMTNISAIKADWTLEGHHSPTMEHMYGDPEHLEMTAL